MRQLLSDALFSVFNITCHGIAVFGVFVVLAGVYWIGRCL